MPVNDQAVGKRYDPVTYAVGREKIREYAEAVGESNPIHLDVDAAREAGHSDVVAPPMFAVVYSGPALEPALFDPDLDIDFSKMVHGGQEFTWGPLVVAGDEITSTMTVKEIYERGPMGFYVLESESKREDGESVATGTWTFIVRGE